jgi:radical SAM protein with 4Fe4S-binding SPASM domain
MIGRAFSLILVPTLDCNVACDYCFEEKRPVRLSLADVPRLTASILDHMAQTGVSDAEVYWQGGEVLLLGPAWFEAAHELMESAAAARGLRLHHYLQSNLIGYGPHWDRVIRTMFDGSVGTSMDVPNDHRRLKNGSTERYTEVWLESVTRARAAGLHVSVIAVVHEGTLRAGPDEFLRFFTERAHVDDVQLNLPFPGGPGHGGGTLAPEPLSRFLIDLLGRWMAHHYERGVRLAPFAELVNHYLGRPARLPCIWQPNCADEFVTIDARGQVALCDCWVASYPDYAFGNVFTSPDLATLLGASAPRRALLERPSRLMDREDCDTCPHLALCHGGCPVRAFASKATILAKDPYCEVYKAVFTTCRNLAGTIAGMRSRAGGAN